MTEPMVGFTATSADFRKDADRVVDERTESNPGRDAEAEDREELDYVFHNQIVPLVGLNVNGLFKQFYCFLSLSDSDPDQVQNRWHHLVRLVIMIRL